MAEHMEIDVEAFNFDTKPKTSSALVRQAKQEVLGEIDLDLLTQSLSRVGKFIRLAYNGVTGDSRNKIKVQRVGIHITRLSDDSALMVHRYGNMARDVLAELQASYQYLCEGFDEIALDSIYEIAVMATKMAEQTGQLCTAFEDIEKEITDAVSSTQKKRTENTAMKNKLEAERKKAEDNINKYEDLKKSAKEAYDKAELYYCQAHAQEEKSTFDLSSIFNHVMNVSSSIELMGTIAKTIIPDGGVTDKTPYPKAFAEEKTKYVKEMKKQRDLERQALSSFGDSTSKIISYRQIDDVNLTDAAILAMHCAIGAVKQIVAVLMNAKRFWKQIHDHCETLRTEAAQEQVKSMVNDQTKRMFSNAFKQQAMKYYSQWVALESVCAEYAGDLKATRAELQQYMKENPTIKESQKAVPQLAKSLEKELSEAKATLDQKDRQADQEMKNLADMEGLQTYPK